MRLAGIPLACVVLAATVHADADPPASLTGPYSPYELDAIHAAESALASVVDPAPEGKIVESIDTIQLQPIEQRDPAPVALDAIHVTTRDDVILHDVLVHVGDPYRKVMVDETARNLRQLSQLSLVLCVAFRGRNVRRVRLIVITKDVWSLYPDFDLGVSSGGLERLLLEPKETNFAGRHQTVLARLLLQPESYSLGAAYIVPRLTGRWLTLTADGNVIVNRMSGVPEGSFGSVSVERPLYSTLTEWGWATGVTWRDEVYRHYVNAEVATFDSQAAPADGIPWVYRSRHIDEQAAITRSFGWARKNDVTLGTVASRETYRLPGVAGHTAAAVADFVRTEVPVGETRVGPFVQWRSYTTDFMRILDFETLGLQEDYRLGYEIVVRAYPVVAALGSSRNLMGVRAAALYTVKLGDGLARAWLDTTTEVEATRISDASISGEVTVVSPRTGIGRIVFDSTMQNRYRNYLTRTSMLGGEGRLRGYPTNYFVGKDLLALNLEYRTRPVELFSSQFGGALFYDVGQAFDGFDHLQPAHSLGFGLRAVFPQIERAVLRGDIGFPIAAGTLPTGVAPVSFFVTFGQAFRAAAVPTPLGP
jgi:hypothetical protein